MIPDIMRKGFRVVYYLLRGRRGVPRSVNGRTYRFSAHVARGIPETIAEPMLEVWIDLTRGARVAFEVGAHVGTYALICSMTAPKGSRIYGFEPSPETYRILCDTARLNRLQGGHADIIPVNKACGATTGVVSFIRDGVKETNRLASAAGQPGNVEVEVITLDAFCEEHAVVPEVMKIDAEGAEVMVLEGMRGVLQANDIVVLIELHHILWHLFDVTGDGLLALVHELGYELYGSDGLVLTRDRIASAGFALMQKPGSSRRWNALTGRVGEPALAS